MREILAFLAANVVLVLSVIVVVAVLVVGYIGFVLWRARAAAVDGEPLDEDTPAPVTAVTQAADLEVSFRRALKTLKASTAGPGYRYRIPWYLTLGPAGSGKSTLLDAVPLPRRVQPDGGGIPSVKTCRWHFFDGGVVLDVAGSLTLKKDLSHDEVGWRRLLALLKRYRPERPVDGVVLTLSAADLLAWEKRPVDELRELGAGLFRRLREAQGELGVRFPVYVVLTHADRLPGFASFVRAVPRRFHQDVFGWSNPYALDAAFRPEWVEEALTEVGERLRDRATEVLASRNLLADADAVFRFPDVADELVPAARTILGEVFEESAYHEGFFFRGIYFTGIEGEESPLAGAQAPEDDDDVPETDEEISSVFLSRLFQKKIFPERGLARGFSTGILDRNRTIRWIQIAAAAVVLIGFPGLFLGQAGLRREAKPLEELLGSVQKNLSIMAPASPSGELTQVGAETVVLDLLQQMATLDAGPFWSVFLPSSWFSGLDGEITQNLTEGFQDVILPTLRQGIVEWADTLADPAWAETLGGRVPLDDPSRTVRVSARFQEYEVLIGYLSELGQYANAGEQFNQLSQAGVDNEMQLFADLFVWYYEQELPQEFFNNDVFYQEALRSASERPVSRADWPGLEERTARMATALAERFYGRLLDAVDGLEGSFAGTVDPAFAASDLRQLWQDVGHVEDLLTSSDSAWFDSEAPMVPALQVMIDSLPASPLFDKATFVQRFTAGFDEVRRRQLTSLSREMDLLARALPEPVDSLGRPVRSGVMGPGGTRIDLAPQLGKLRASLGDLLSRDFMAPTGSDGEQLRPGLAGRPTWSVAPLEEALEYFSEYQTFRDGALGEIPAELRGLVLGVAGRALEERVRWSLGRAMTYEVGVGPEGRAGLEEDLRKRLAAFDQAARRLVGMLEVDDQVGGTPAGGAVAEVIILEGSDLLNQVDVLLLQDGLYQPVNGNLAVWRGARPASLAGFGAAGPDELEAYLAQQRATLRGLSQFAAPVLGYLALQPVADKLRSDGPELVPETEPLVRKWRGIVRTLDEFEAKAPGNTLEALEQFIRQGMSVASLSGCVGVTAPTGSARDYFEGVQLRLGRMLADRCRQLARQALLDGYDRMSRFYAAQLEGRFPFADLEALPTAPDAEVAAVVSFLRMYDEVTQPLAGDPALLVDNLLRGELSADFFREMAEIRAFLGPVVLPDAEGLTGTLHVLPGLRTNRRSERGADQIVEWRVGIAGSSLTYRGAGDGASMPWRPGDAVTVTLTWASESQRRPVAVPGRMDLSAEGATATWRYTGPWSLLRLLQANRPRTADLTGAPRDDRATVNLRVLTRSRDAVTEPQDVRDAEASVFLRLSVRATVGGTELMTPRFPTQTPPPARR